jgi:cyclopropane fatty-acyl-phospholipid synthase-like methyltransferase
MIMVQMNNWDIIWLKNNISPSKIDENIWKMYHNKVFKVYKKFLNNFKIKNPKIIELGCGSGELTARIIKNYGGVATLIDNSKEALFLSSKVFKKYGLKAKFLRKDLFRFKPQEKFDIVHSEGLIEHFLGDKQKKIIEVHKNCVKKDGLIIITVPRPVWYYKIVKWILEKINKWPFGFEKAMNKYELKEVLEDGGLKVLEILHYSRYSFALAKI